MSNKIKAEETPRSFFTMIPNLIDDMDLNPYEFRLYAHIRRVIGENNESCWQSTSTLADACNMSMGKVSESKTGLAEKGLIRISSRSAPGGLVHDIVVVDVWIENEKYREMLSCGEQPSQDESLLSQIREMPSPHESQPSPHETKKNYKEELIKNNKKEKQFTNAPALETYESNSSLDEIAMAIAEVCKMDKNLNRGQIYKYAKKLIDAGKTAEEVILTYGEEQPWYTHHWKGQKGQPPTPASIVETIGTFAGVEKKPSAKQIFEEVEYDDVESDIDYDDPDWFAKFKKERYGTDKTP